MSRGPGKWQRRILARLTHSNTYWLRTLLPRHAGRSEYNALLRAALTLEAAGSILLDRYCWGATPGTGRTAVRRVGAPQPPRNHVVSVGNVHSRNSANTCEPN